MNILLAKLCQCFTHVMRRLFCVSVEDSCIDAPCSHTCRPNPLSDGIYQCECTLMSVRMRVMYVIRNVEILKDLINVGVDQGTKKSIRLNARTLMSVPTAVMTVNRFV